MKHHLVRAIVFVTAVGMPSVAAAGSLTLAIHDGRVTMVAQDVPVRQILNEWARVGQTTIVNADQVFGPPVTMQLVDVPEREALDTLLRSVSGYIAAPRAVALANASLYDRVTIMATSHAPAMSAVPSPVQTFQRPPRGEDEPVNPMLEQQLELQQQNLQNMQDRLLQQQRTQTSPVVMPYPGMMPPAGQQGPVTSALPGVAPVMTSPRPGALPQPQTQSQPGLPNQPKVIRPAGPGGGGPGGQ